MDTPEEIFRAPISRLIAWFLGAVEFLHAWVEDGRVWTEMGPFATQEVPEIRAPGLEAMVRPDEVTLAPADAGPEAIRART